MTEMEAHEMEYYEVLACVSGNMQMRRSQVSFSDWIWVTVDLSHLEGSSILP